MRARRPEGGELLRQAAKQVRRFPEIASVFENCACVVVAEMSDLNSSRASFIIHFEGGV